MLTIIVVIVAHPCFRSQEKSLAESCSSPSYPIKSWPESQGALQASGFVFPMLFFVDYPTMSSENT